MLVRTNRVNLKILSSQTHRSTLMPSGFIKPMDTSSISIILHTMTRQSKRLKKETKYCEIPKPQIFSIISSANMVTKK